MTEETVPAPVLLPRQAERWQALVDILYIFQLVSLYLFSAVYPFVGLFYGLLLMLGSVSPRAKKVGRICLIIGIVNTALFAVGLVLFLVLGLAGVLAGLGE
ncbi:MAG TPA: hypothetical protein ENN51_07010 [candidate division WOR-3 bacterium]|uniref:Uncharacterized protein n=1 Tax=candidate division WOR-3 bacterium TaxID=2052148 RepID=A0A7V0XFS7_UNCW3|nr:hypothetical protein [candidate division WOR-3 bacterium]